MDNNSIRKKVKEANKLLYEKVADNYEEIDGRRSEELLFWLRDRLKNISERFNGNTILLDIGCGSGFVIKAAQGLFAKLYGIDVSENILKKASIFADGVVCADVDFAPFKKESIDVAVLFAAVHHFYDYRGIIKEIHRILKRGGILYMDHDMNKEFARRFRFLLWLYRKLSRRKKKYIDAGIDGEIYDLSEFHSGGIDVDKVLNYLREFGFEIFESYYHWYGLNHLTDSIFKHRRFKKRNAPLMSILARRV